MLKIMLFQILLLAALMAANVAAAQSTNPDLHGIWRGESETIVVGTGNTHHPAAAAEEPQFRSVPFFESVRGWLNRSSVLAQLQSSGMNKSRRDNGKSQTNAEPCQRVAKPNSRRANKQDEECREEPFHS